MGFVVRVTCALLLSGCIGCEESGGPFDDPVPDPPPPPVVRPTPPPPDGCAGYACLPCATAMADCADAPPFLDGTCCAEGDPLVRLGAAAGDEVVDLAADDQLVIACGGFGARISDVSDPSAPRSIGGVTPRCQHAALGPERAEGRVFFLTHHGDTWVDEPAMWTYRHNTADGTLELLATTTDPDVLFEGLAYANGRVYVTAHDGGLRVYALDVLDRPILRATLGGLGNAAKVELDGDLAYVVDWDTGIHVVSIEDPLSPRLVHSVVTSGPPRDLAIGDGRLYVALGGLGVDVLDASDPTRPTVTARIEIPGSAQSVSVAEGVLAVAAWSHVALYDAEHLNLLATQKTRVRTSFEQDLAVALVGRVLHVGEWEGVHLFQYRPGRVAPDIWLDDELYSFAGDVPEARAVVVRNWGALPLAVDHVSTGTSSYTVDTTTLSIAPGEADVFEVLLTPPAVGRDQLTISSNDPDEGSLELVLSVAEGARIGVGDRLTDAFAFLDPSGAGQLSGLEGHVTVLAYFALF